MSRALVKATEGALVVSNPGPLERNPAAVYLAGKAPGSRRALRGALDLVARLVSGGAADALSLDWGRLRYQHLAAVRSELAAKYAPKYVGKILSAVKGTLGAAYDLRQMPADAYGRCMRVKGVKAFRLPAGRAPSPGEVIAIFNACAMDGTAAGVRDAAVLALLRCGLRRAEVAGAEVGAVDMAGGSIRVIGKGNKERSVPFPSGAGEALADWLELRGDAPGPLFRQVNKAGRIGAAGLTPQAVYDVLRRRAGEAKVADLTPHDWRRGMIGDLLDAGVDLVVVSRIVGHVDPATTAGYDRRPEGVKRDAMGRLHVPYVRRTLRDSAQRGL